MFGRTKSRSKRVPDHGSNNNVGWLSRLITSVKSFISGNNSSSSSPLLPTPHASISNSTAEPNIPRVVNYRPGDIAFFDPGATTQESFRVVRKLGEGGCGSVYEVEDSENRKYALKVLDLWKKQPMEWRSLKLRFEKSYAAGRLGSDYLVKYFHKGNCKGNPAILMEFCGGGDLEDRMPEFYRSEAYEPMIVKLLYGLQTLHNSGCIHRDIKLKNILFDEVGNPKLTDFDLSAFLNNRTTVSVRGKVKEMWFTPIFAAPESLREKDVYRLTLPPMDMFAFGVTIYHLLTSGKYPWGSLDDFEADQEAYFARQSRGEYQPITFHRPEMDPNWAHAIHSCLEPDPGKRMPGPYHFLQMVNHEAVIRRDGGETPTPTAEGMSKARAASANETEVIEDSTIEPNEEKRYGLEILSGGTGRVLINLEDTLKQNGSGEGILIIGRRDPDTEQDIAVDEIPKPNDDFFVSRQHATLKFEEGCWYVRDGVAVSETWKDSTNETEIYNAETGSYENISGRGFCKLNEGDIITLAGEVKLKFITL